MGAPAARAEELSTRWAQVGHEVTILTGFPNHPTGVLHSEYRKKFRRVVVREQMNGVKVVRTWLWPLPNRKSFERMLNYASFCLSAALTGIFVERPDVLIATSPQLLVGLSGWWLSRLKRVPFVFEIRDLWPESLSAVGMQDQSLLYAFLSRIAKFLYRKSDHIVVVTPAFKDHLISYWDVPAEKISVIYNGVETQLFHPSTDTSELRRELNAEGKFVVSYIGTMGWAHGLNTLIEAALIMQSSQPNVLFLLVGEGADKERVIELSKSKGLHNLLFVGQQPREKIPDYINASDVCLVLLKKTDVFKTVIPTKMLEFMACGRPIILGVDGQARTIVEEAAAGMFVEPENTKGLVEAVRALSADPEGRKAMGKSGREYIVRKFSRKETATTYAGVLARICRRKRNYLTE